MTPGHRADQSPATEASASAAGFGRLQIEPLRLPIPTLRRPRRAPELPSDETRVQLRLVRASDTVAVVAALIMSFVIANIGHMPDGLSDFLALRITVKNLVLLVLFVVLWRLLGRLTGVYDWKAIKSPRSECTRVIMTCTLVSTTTLFFPTVSVTGAFNHWVVLYFGIGSCAATLLLRHAIRTLVYTPEACRPRDALIVGSGRRAQQLEHELRSFAAHAYNVVGFVDCADHRSPGTRSPELLGSLDGIERILMHSSIDEVLITLPIKSHYAAIKSVLEACERVGVPARYLADLFDPIKGRASHEGDRPALIMTPPAPSGWARVSKRTVDLAVATVALVALAPALLVAAVAIKVTSRGPVLFAQDRYGLHRRRFRMYKLRTMVVEAESLQATLEDRNEASGPVFKIREDPRITPVGRILRRTSLDEVPQLVNVLRGEMSLVGPRPLPARDVERFTEAAMMRRFSIRPGVTCLWQINGRSELAFDDWMKLDLKYIDEWSILLDLRILLQTVPAVLRGTGAS